MRARTLALAGLVPGTIVRLQSVKCGRALRAEDKGRVTAAGGSVSPQAALFEVVAIPSDTTTAAATPPAIRLRNVLTGTFLRIVTGGTDCGGQGGPWTHLQPLVVRGAAGDEPPVICLRSARFARSAFVAVQADGSLADPHNFANDGDALDSSICHFVPHAVKTAATA